MAKEIVRRALLNIKWIFGRRVKTTGVNRAKTIPLAEAAFGITTGRFHE
jgi:hypothetical protein